MTNIFLTQNKYCNLSLNIVYIFISLCHIFISLFSNRSMLPSFTCIFKQSMYVMFNVSFQEGMLIGNYFGAVKLMTTFLVCFTF